MDLVAELEAMLADLERANVSYALCGALALAVHGVARYTSDIDLLVDDASLGAAIEVVKARGFVFGAAPMGFSDGVELHRWSKLVDRQVLTVDLMLPGPAYRDVLAARQPAPIGRGSGWVVSREGLITMKLRAGRAKDIADVQALAEIDR